MAREIKFRGKSKADGKWVEGAYFDLHHNDERKHIHHFIIPDGTPIPKERPIGEIQVEIDLETLGQFTGLFDKNGREIYEGDILRKNTFVDNDFTETYLDRDTIGVVRILPSCGTTICNCIVYETDDPYEEKKMKERIKRAHVVGKRCEIIGNIHDDPELLN